MSEFRIGDRVVGVAAFDDNETIVGNHGRVLNIRYNGGNVLVEYDEEIENGHTGEGLGQYGHCWWTDRECLALETEVDQNRISFDDLMGG